MTMDDESLHTADEPVLSEEVRSKMETRLLEERDRSQEGLDQSLEDETEPPAESSGNLSKLPSHPADAGSQTDDTDVDFRIAERSTEHINLIDAALRRLRDHPEAYGLCQVCGERIALERLELLPWTIHCADDAPDSGNAEAEPGTR